MVSAKHCTDENSFNLIYAYMIIIKVSKMLKQLPFSSFRGAWIQDFHGGGGGVQTIMCAKPKVPLDPPLLSIKFEANYMYIMKCYLYLAESSWVHATMVYSLKKKSSE